MSLKGLDSYLQAPYQEDRAEGPTERHRAQLAALLGEAPDGEEGVLAGYLRTAHGESAGTALADDTDPERFWAVACLHGLRAAASAHAINYLPLHVAQVVRQVGDALAAFGPTSA